ncbi:probable E3 ubiquitin-protein ligase RNF217 isoform X2 [Olea europaea var. sylvestris]|uniref:probable E3 ubiquitin-protein ligase RNF217 isoform X1 n=1 Tax=Olea europaea var. sylvestris TaxID=158386 RepID=UPI000C1D433A|nr:probable E3 ubiquitin-protein ligase RNF217 isoform X1 [Olea europaea var. sylvestris]XP_022898254.1 probable E3 ubiquitin-protein ligase RNF217 isoform X1 [Olea europaea var. sylvestris]XP_022898260.1 probable E3 ubiquitin-protein ligase RNF217 isoform X2 [Olea europaea var. sylvestris]
MASDVLEFLNIADNDATAASVDDDLIVLYSTPASIKKGTSKMNPISVEDYPLRAKRVIDLSQDFTYYDIGSDDDEVKVLDSFSKIRRKIYKGESSNQKSAKDVESGLPMTFVCEICVDEKPTNELFRVLGCTHSYCSECIAKYVASKLQQNTTIITCPVLGCKGVLEPHHCRSVLPKQVFDMWGDALCEAVVLASEKFYCPFKDCSAMLIDDMRGRNEVITQSECPNCNRLFCAQCKVPWHLGIQCAEFQKLKKDERNNEDIMLMNLAKSKKWMRCPKCSFYVEKSEGCLFITCSFPSLISTAVYVIDSYGICGLVNTKEQEVKILSCALYDVPIIVFQTLL